MLLNPMVPTAELTPMDVGSWNAMTLLGGDGDGLHVVYARVTGEDTDTYTARVDDVHPVRCPIAGLRRRVVCTMEKKGACLRSGPLTFNVVENVPMGKCLQDAVDAADAVDSELCLHLMMVEVPSAVDTKHVRIVRDDGCDYVLEVEYEHADVRVGKEAVVITIDRVDWVIAAICTTSPAYHHWGSKAIHPNQLANKSVRDELAAMKTP